MKTSVAGVIPCAVLCAACGPSEEDLRRMVREEMNAAAEKTTIAPVGVIGPHSPAVRVGRFLFVSGQIALDPENGTAIQVPPHSWMASILSQTDVDIHPGEEATKQFTAGITRLPRPSLTREDYITLREAGICALEKDERYLFVRASRA